MFSTYSSRVAELLQKIESGEIALPDLQRPFVWEDAKVRNLLDSMNKGFPVGYVMLWDFPDDYDAKPRSSAIAKSGTRSVRSLLIDGQQRLTALLSAMDGIVVKDKDYRDRRIRISFNPLAKADDGKQIGQFEVWTSATEKDPEWVRFARFRQRTRRNDSARRRRSFLTRGSATSLCRKFLIYRRIRSAIGGVNTGAASSAWRSARTSTAIRRK